MRKILFKYLSIACVVTAIAVSISACSSDNDPILNGDADNKTEENFYFHLIVGVGNDGNDGTFTQAAKDISDADHSITFVKYGFEVPSTRTARIIG